MRLRRWLRGTVEPSLRAELASGRRAGPGPCVRDVGVCAVRAQLRSDEVRPSLSCGAARARAVLASSRCARRKRGADHPALVARCGWDERWRATPRCHQLGRPRTRRGRAPEALARLPRSLRRVCRCAWDVAACLATTRIRARLLAAGGATRVRDRLPRTCWPRARPIEPTRAQAARDCRALLEHGGRFDEALRDLRTAIELAESDDRVFFEAQRLIRRWLLRRGEALVRAGRLDTRQQIFELSPELSLAEPRATAEQNRAARLRAARHVPPTRILDRRAFFSAPSGSEVLRGRGLGGRARGIAFVQRALFGADGSSLADVPDGAVLVLPAALPSLAPHLARLWLRW